MSPTPDPDRDRPVRRPSADDGFRLTDRPADDLPEPTLPRLFLREPSWRVAVKVGSERMFCYVALPGQDAYHRIVEGELYLHRGDEKICLPCADRHGLLHHEPKLLREPMRGLDVSEPDSPDADYDVRDRIDRPLSDGAPDRDFLS